MYLIDILFKRLKLFYLYSKFNYCVYIYIYIRIRFRCDEGYRDRRLLSMHSEILLGFRGAGGCDYPPVVVHIVQYFGRLESLSYL